MFDLVLFVVVCRGHNELDDPTFTNPSMYKIIHNRPSVPDQYAERLIQKNVVPPEYFADRIIAYNEEMSTALAQADKYQPEKFHFLSDWRSCHQARDDIVTTWDTGVYIVISTCYINMEGLLSYINFLAACLDLRP